jgi:hypothetical protein
MTKTKLLVLCSIALFLIAVASSCKPQCDANATFLQTVGLTPDNDLNNSMTMRYLNNQKVIFRAGEHLNLEVIIKKLTSPFKLVTNASSFYFKLDSSTCEWVKLENLTLEINPDLTVYPNSLGLEELFLTIIIIDPAAITEPTEVRVYFVGYYLGENGDVIEPVAAFKDVMISP